TLIMKNVDFFFFFQAEDGIRDYKVTGVQTCALPISMTIATVWWAASKRSRRARRSPHLNAKKKRAARSSTSWRRCGAVWKVAAHRRRGRAARESHREALRRREGARRERRPPHASGRLRNGWPIGSRN